MCWALDSGIKVVLFIVTILALLGFTQMSSTIQYAEGAVSWNGFLREIGFGGTQVYEVSEEGVLLQGELISEDIDILCLEGDIMYVSREFVHISNIIPTPPAGTEFSSTGGIIRADSPPEVSGSKPIGFSFRGGIVDVSFGDGILSPSDFVVTGTIVCLSPSPFANAIGGTMIPIDSTALLLAGAQMNAVWMIPVVVAGVGIGIFVIKRRK